MVNPLIRDSHPQPSISDIKPKMKLSGKVIKITLAGAFVDIGAKLPGIIHISQLRKGPVKRVEDVVQVGDTIEAWVRRVNERAHLVELTMIEPLPLEWREIKKGMIVKGKVTRLEKYGAFVDIGAERPAMIHISEITHDYIRTPDEYLHVGDEVEAKVIQVNRRKKQIKLSTKALEQRTPKPKAEKKEKEKQEETQLVPTAMEIALRKAMEQAKEKPQSAPKKPKPNAVNPELDEILTRTLDKQVQIASEN